MRLCSVDFWSSSSCTQSVRSHGWIQRQHTDYRPRRRYPEFLQDAIHRCQVMLEARKRLDEILPHSCPLSTLPTENHRNGRRDLRSLGETRHLKLTVMANSECPLGKPFSVNGESIREVWYKVRVITNIGLVRINLTAEGI